jgi:hypothetical protein
MMMRLVEYNKYAVVSKEKMLRVVTRWEDLKSDGLGPPRSAEA